MGEAITWKRFNEAFGRVLRFLGYAPLGTAISRDKVSAYLTWCKHIVPELYFSNDLAVKLRSLVKTATNEIERPHRRFLNDLFREGQEAVIEASKSKRTLAERVREYEFRPSSSEGCRVYKSRSLPRRYDSGRVVYGSR